MIKFKKFQRQTHVYLGSLHAGFVHFNLIPNLGECAFLIAAEVLEHLNELPATEEDVVLKDQLVLPDVYVTTVFSGNDEGFPYVDPVPNGERLGEYHASFNSPLILDKFNIQGFRVRALAIKVEDWRTIRDGNYRRTVSIVFYQAN